MITSYQKFLFQQLILPTRAGNPFFVQQEPLVKGVKWLKEKALSQSSCKLGKRIYVSRNKARYRKILNEQEILTVLNDFGFQMIFLEDYSLADQVSICNNAEVILGLHGAGLTNLVFMKPNSMVIEIRPDHKYQMYGCFFTICPHFSIKYRYILCQYVQQAFASEKRIDDRSVVISPIQLRLELNHIFHS